MAAAAPLTAAAPPPASQDRRVLAVRVAIVLVALVAWQALAMSGWLFRDVVPPLQTIGRALAALLGRADFYANLGVTAMEVGVAVLIGGLAGLAVGIALGANRFLSNAFEALLLYLGPTPKIVFLPVMIMWFGVALRPKITRNSGYMSTIGAAASAPTHVSVARRSSRTR